MSVAPIGHAAHGYRRLVRLAIGSDSRRAMGARPPVAPNTNTPPHARLRARVPKYDKSAPPRLRDEDDIRRASCGHAVHGGGRLIRPRNELPRPGRRAMRAVAVGLRMATGRSRPRVCAMILSVESAPLTRRDDDCTRRAALGHTGNGVGRLVRPSHRLPRLGRRASRAPPPSAQNGKFAAHASRARNETNRRVRSAQAEGRWLHAHSSPRAC